MNYTIILLIRCILIVKVSHFFCSLDVLPAAYIEEVFAKIVSGFVSHGTEVAFYVTYE